MARRKITIDEKIERQKEVVSRAKDRYDAALEELKELMEKKNEQNCKALLDAYDRGSVPVEEIIEFIESRSNSGVES